nr:TPA_asm: hypothetical protein [Sphaeridio phenuili virus]
MAAPSSSNSLAHKFVQIKTPGFNDMSVIMEARREFAAVGFEHNYDDDNAQLFIYQGFEPDKLFQAMSAKAASISDLREDVVVLCTIFCIRGNNVDKMVKSMPDGGKVKLQQLVAKYGIRKNIRNHPDAITLSRIALTFPPYSMKAAIDLHKQFLKPVRSCLDSIHILLRLPVFSAFMKLSFAEHVYWLSLASSVVLSSVIGSKDDTLGEARRYFTAAQETRPFMENLTREKMIHWKLMYAPANWQMVGMQLKQCLNVIYDMRKIREVMVDLEPILSSVVPPPEWEPYVLIPPTPAPTPEPSGSGN